MSYLRYYFWSAYYAVFGMPNGSEQFSAYILRTMPPWPFQPYVYHSEAGKQWQVYFKGDPDYTERRTISLDVHVSQETGEIVGFKVSDWQLREPPQ